MESGHSRGPLNFKVLAYHRDRVRAGEALPLELLDLKTVLMPMQWFLNKLDPYDDLTRSSTESATGTAHDRVQGPRLARSCNPRDDGQEGIGHLQEFHFLYWQPSWGRIPFSCSCPVCFPNVVRQVRQDTLLFASLFGPEVLVPDAWPQRRYLYAK